MIDHMAKSEFLDRVQRARADWDAAMARIPAEEMARPGFCGDWSLKDVVGHIAWYEREMIGVLERRDFSGSDLWDLEVHERNAAIHEQIKGRPLAEAVEEGARTFARLMELLESVTEDELNDPKSFPGMPLEWQPWSVLASNTYEHYEAHLKQARAWLGE